MSAAFLRELVADQAMVRKGTTLAESARILAGSGVSAIAVVQRDDSVIGLFTEDDLLLAIAPGYLPQLRHTAGVRLEGFPTRHRFSIEPIENHMRDPVVVDLDASLLHIAEVFLHAEPTAVAVVAGGCFVGMLAQSTFCSALLTASMPGF